MQSQVKRSDLYGRTTKVVTDKDGKALSTGVLTQEGQLLEKNQFSGLSIDETGSFNGSAQYVCDGETVEAKPSSFKEAREMESVPLELLNEFAVEAVYPIESETELAVGLYSTTFNYTQSVEPKDCLVLVEEGQSYLLTGRKLEFAPAGKAVIYNLFDEDEAVEEEEDADFDFGDAF
ncbi:MAG: hypothetical protein ACPGVU_07440 [Limisphaerales bacterium]